jgi:hypothetical protein
MYKIIGGDGKEYGPLSAAQIIDYLDDNRANAHTLARPLDVADWKPLSSFPEFSAVLARKAITPPPLPSGPQPTISPSPFQPQDIPTYIVPAIFVNLCLCPVFAIPALYYAAQVNKKINAGDIPAAKKASLNARKWCWIGFVGGALSAAAYSILIGKIIK